MDPLEKLVVTTELLALVAGIDEFKGRWTAIGRLEPERLSALRHVATIESVGSSTRIEGVKLTDAEIETLLSGLDIQSFRSRDEQEVAGYAELMELIFEAHDEMPLTENHVQQLHGVLLKYSEKDVRHRGHYKNHANSVEAFDATGNSLGVMFETASPFDTPRLMKELLAWTNATLDTRAHHPLLVISVFVVRLLAIHPFGDGNGRLSRVLSTLLLLRSGYDYVPYSSLERVVEDNKDEYYRTLRRARASLDDDEAGLSDWILFFVRCLSKQAEVLAHRIDTERLMAPLPPLSQSLLDTVDSHGRLTVREAVAVTGGNRNTIKQHLSQLVRAGQLVRRGVGRGTWYGRP